MLTPQQNLDDQLRDIILSNGGDINITDYPHLIKEAETLGIKPADMPKHIGKVFDTIDWLPYRNVDTLLEPFLERGYILEKDANGIVAALENDLRQPEVVNYIIVFIKRRSFLPREKNSFIADSFKNIWATVDGYRKYLDNLIEVEWLDEKAHSLEEMAEISYRKPEDAKYYLRNANYIVPSVNTLTRSASKADGYAKIIESEPNPDKRYLKVIYRLYNKLPFKLSGNDYKDIKSVFEATAKDYTLFRSASQNYQDGFIHIWLDEADPVNNDKLTKEYHYNGFLKFLYKINSQHPFYLFSRRFDTPQQLAEQANGEAALWTLIAEVTADGQLQTWLAGIGRQDWVNVYNSKVKQINAEEFYTDEEKQLAITQAFILLVGNGVSDPHLTANPQKIYLPALEGSKITEHTIQLSLANSGFAKANIFISSLPEGLELSDNQLAFWSQGGKANYTLTLHIDALQLVKDSLYQLAISIETEYENLSVPVEVKVVFPKKAYVWQVLKYALFGFGFFALIRYLTGVMTESQSWFVFSHNEYSSLPRNYFAYFIGMALLIGGMIGAIFLIRKAEKV